MFHAWRSRLLVKLGLTLMFRGYFDIAWSKLWHKNGVFDKMLGCFLINLFGKIVMFYFPNINYYAVALVNNETMINQCFILNLSYFK